MDTNETTERMAAALARLEELRGRIGEIEKKECSDAAFALRFLKFSSATYSRLRAGKYGAKVTNMLAQCEAAAENIEARIEALQKRAEADKTFVRTRFAQAVMGAYIKAQDDPDCPVIIALAPTGAGKTEIGRHLTAKSGGVYVEGRQSWQSSYKAFCADVAAAAKHPIGATHYDEHRAEESMLEALGARASLLYIDEANTLGRSIANAIKLVANQTAYVVVVAAIPEMWDEFVKRSVNEVRQVLNRTQAVIRFDGNTEGDVKAFMLGCGVADADMPAAVRKVCEAANESGALKVVKRVAAWLREQESPALADVDKAITLIKAGLDEVKGKKQDVKGRR